MAFCMVYAVWNVASYVVFGLWHCMCCVTHGVWQFAWNVVWVMWGEAVLLVEKYFLKIVLNLLISKCD